MIRKQVLEIADSHLLPAIKEMYGLNDYKITEIEGHEGGRNIAYLCENADQGDKIIRIAFLPDRKTEDFLSELAYVRYLYEHGGSVANVVDSCNGRLLEEITYKGYRLFISVFDKAQGEQLADHGYCYREGAPLSEYFYNCGKTLGKLHALSKKYEPVYRRYSFFDKYNAAYINQIIPDSLPVLKEKLLELIQTLALMDRSSEIFGMVHFDYGDGNYMIDYKTGSITVFDFDNTCFCWYMIDLANVWHNGVGWIQFEPNAKKRQQFMEAYFETVLEGYRSETTIDDQMLEKLPLFIKVNTMESIIDTLEMMYNNEDKLEYDGHLSYLIKCIEEEIPYEGFFHKIYSCDQPFESEERQI